MELVCNVNNLCYADDAVFLSDKRIQLERIMDKYVRVCNDYNMEINVKKTKAMVISKKQGTKCATKYGVHLLWPKNLLSVQQIDYTKQFACFYC